MASEHVRLGEIIEGEAYRDAVHVAVFPAVSDHDMEPGDTVRVTGERRGQFHVVEWIEANHPEAHGIVDPFLLFAMRLVVPAGQPFYGLLKPGTATGLRHWYSHPAFKATQPPILEHANAK